MRLEKLEVQDEACERLVGLPLSSDTVNGEAKTEKVGAKFIFAFLLIFVGLCFGLILISSQADEVTLFKSEHFPSSSQVAETEKQTDEDKVNDKDEEEEKEKEKEKDEKLK